MWQGESGSVWRSRGSACRRSGRVTGSRGATGTQWLVGATLAGLTAGAAAHPGHEQVGAAIGAGGSLWLGFSHPFSGLDHLLAMLALGLWAAMVTRRWWLPPLVFLGVMALGAGFGMLQLPVPGVEPMIAASLLVIGLLLASLARLPETAIVVLAAVFAVFHGAAHGAEMPATVGAAAYLLGFLLATALLHVAGAGAGALAAGTQRWPARLGGLGIAGYGAMLLAG